MCMYSIRRWYKPFHACPQEEQSAWWNSEDGPWEEGDSEEWGYNDGGYAKKEENVKDEWSGTKQEEDKWYAGKWDESWRGRHGWQHEEEGGHWSGTVSWKNGGPWKKAKVQRDDESSTRRLGGHMPTQTHIHSCRCV